MYRCHAMTPAGRTERLNWPGGFRAQEAKSGQSEANDQDLRRGTVQLSTLSEDDVTIDEGMRRWHASCPCCLGDAYPEIRKVLDAEAMELGAQKEGCSGDPFHSYANSNGTDPDDKTEAEDGDLFEPGGDAACWAHLVCEECGAIVSDGHRAGCSIGDGD